MKIEVFPVWETLICYFVTNITFLLHGVQVFFVYSGFFLWVFFLLLFGFVVFCCCCCFLNKDLTFLSLETRFIFGRLLLPLPSLAECSTSSSGKACAVHKHRKIWVGAVGKIKNITLISVPRKLISPSLDWSAAASETERCKCYVSCLQEPSPHFWDKSGRFWTVWCPITVLLNSWQQS